MAGDASKPIATVTKYHADRFEESICESLSGLAQQVEPGVVTWIQVKGYGDVGALQELGESFGLHGLAMEDAINSHQRAKVEVYDDHLFIVLQMVAANSHVESAQLSLFLGKDFVLTLQQEEADCLAPVRERLRKGRGRMRSQGADFLAYSIVDAIIDSYFPAVDSYAERLEWLDEEITGGQAKNLTEEIQNVRANLMALRRLIQPLRDSLVALMPDPHSLISDETQFYFRDCFDHTIQLIELLDAYRETCASLRDYYITAINLRMNEIMKILTIVSTIFIPLSFVASVYGMNFDTSLPGNMPELHWPYGYVVILGLMASVTFGQFLFIWRKGWLSS